MGLDIRPQRAAVQNSDGSWLLTITPPAWSGWPASQITLSDAQYKRYLLWLHNGTAVKAVFPDLSIGKQEQLVSGISPEDWDREFGNEEEEA